MCNASGLCDTSTLTITVNPVNDAPIATSKTTSTNEDVATSGTVATGVTNVDGGALTFTQVGTTPSTEGVFTLNPNGTYTFTPANNFNGVVVVTYQVCNASGLCDTTTLTITVNPVNDAPIATSKTTSTNEDVATSGTVATGVTNVDGGVLTFTQVGTTPRCHCGTW